MGAIYTIYAYWNAAQYYTVLNSIVGIMGGNDFAGLMKSVALIGLIVAAGTALVRMRGEEPFGWLLMLVLFNAALFVPRVTVSVYDVRTANVYTVDNVPLGIAFFGATTSHVGYWLTTSFETNFTPIDDEKYSKNGLVFGSRLIENLQKVKMIDPVRMRDITKFTEDCVNPEIASTPPNFTGMMNAPDLWAYYGGFMNPGRMTIITVAGVATAQSCPAAYTALGPVMTAEAQSIMDKLGRRINPTDPNATITIVGQIQSVENSMLGASRSAVDAIKQGMVLNAFTTSQATIAAMNNDPQATQISYAVTAAEQSSAISYRAMAEVAQSALPKLRNAVELIVYALFPVMFLLVLMAGNKGGLVLKSYVMALVWVQLWPPLYAVINFLALTADKTGIMAQLGGAAVPTLETFRQVADYSLGSQAITGMLTISIPIIALAIVKGGEVAMSGVASSVMAPAQGAAQRAGDSAGVGNFGAGNVSWSTVGMHNSSTNNVGGNKWDTSGSYTSGSMRRQTDAYGSDTWQQGGSGPSAKPSGPVLSQTASSSMGAFSAGGSREAGRTNTWSSAQESSIQSGLKSMIQSSINSAWSTANSSGSRTQHDSGWTTTSGTVDRGGSTDTWGSGTTTGSSIGNQSTLGAGNTYAASGTFNFGSSANANAPGGGSARPGGAAPAGATGGGFGDRLKGALQGLSGAASLGLGAGLSHVKRASDGHDSTATQDARTQGQTSNQIAKAKENVDQIARTTSDSTSRFVAQQVSSELGKALAASQALEQSYGRSARGGTGQQDSVGVKTQFIAGAEQMAFAAFDAAGFSRAEARKALVQASGGEAPTNARAALALQIAQNAGTPMAAGQVAGMEGLSMTSLQGPTSAGELEGRGQGAVTAANQANRDLVQGSPRGGSDSGLAASAMQRFGAGLDSPAGGGGAGNGNAPDAGSPKPPASAPASSAASGSRSRAARMPSAGAAAPAGTAGARGAQSASASANAPSTVRAEFEARRAAVDDRANAGINAINNEQNLNAGIAATTMAVRSNNMEQNSPISKSVADMTAKLASQDNAFAQKVRAAGMSFRQSGQVHPDQQREIINDLAKAEKRGAFK